ncbi:MAG: hypothetical protein ACOH2H_14940 [Cypionkella sp.]
MLKRFLLCLGLALMPALAVAQDSAHLEIGHDVYLAGNAPTFAGDAATEDVFIAGQRVSLTAPVLGAAHLAGRKVLVQGAVGSDLFAAGYSVDVAAPVKGDATLAGFEVTVRQGVGGNLRAGANDLTVDGAVGGYALMSAATLTMNGVVTGDAMLSADSISFGPEARIGGALTVYAANPSAITVPETVAPAGRVTIKQRTAENASEWGDINPVRINTWSVIGSVVMGIIMTGLLALLVIALAPKQVQLWREVAQAHPWRAILSGFLVASALAGSGIVLALTIVGIFLIPVVVVLVIAAIFAGYALGSYVLGSALWQAFGRAMPDKLLGKFGMAMLGAAVVAVLWFVPILGWFLALGVTLLGIGTLAALVLPGNLMLNRGHVAAVSGN